MLSRSRRNKLAIYFSSMILLHALIFLQEWPLVPMGFPDFSIFYTAARILRQGHAANLYDDSLQEAVQRSFAVTAVDKRGCILPYNHPPFEALIFVPFTGLPFLPAYFVWLGINCALLIVLLLLLRAHLHSLSREPAWLCVLAGFAFFPLYVVLVQGQDSILLLFCYVMAFRSCGADIPVRGSSELTAGLWLGLGLFKFHLVLPFLFVLLLQKRFRLIAGTMIAGLGLALTGLATVGWHGLLSYPSYVLWTDRAAKFGWNFVHNNNPNLRALILSILPAHNPRLAPLLVVSVSLALIAFVAWLGKSPMKAGAESGQLALAMTIVANVLVSYHTWVQDLSLVLLPILLTANVLLSSHELGVRTRQVLWASLAVLSCSPIYAVLLLRFGQFQFMALVLIVFLAALLRASQELSSAKPPPA